MDTPPTPFEALTEAVARAGSQTEFARICGIAQPSVWKMLQTSKRLTAEYVLRVEEATDVSRHYLRPDLYPLPVGDDLPPFEFNRGPLQRKRAPARKAPSRRRVAQQAVQA